MVLVAKPGLGQTVQTQNIINGVSLDGNVSGPTALISSGTVIVAGGNNITLMQSGNSVSIFGAAAGTGAGIYGIAGSGSSAASTGTVQFANSNGLVFGISGNTITASVSLVASQIGYTNAGWHPAITNIEQAIDDHIEDYIELGLTGRAVPDGEALEAVIAGNYIKVYAGTGQIDYAGEHYDNISWLDTIYDTTGFAAGSYTIFVDNVGTVGYQLGDPDHSQYIILGRFTHSGVSISSYHSTQRIVISVFTRLFDTFSDLGAWIYTDTGKLIIDPGDPQKVVVQTADVRRGFMAGSFPEYNAADAGTNFFAAFTHSTGAFIRDRYWYAPWGDAGIVPTDRWNDITKVHGAALSADCTFNIGSPLVTSATNLSAEVAAGDMVWKVSDGSTYMTRVLSVDWDGFTFTITLTTNYAGAGGTGPGSVSHALPNLGTNKWVKHLVIRGLDNDGTAYLVYGQAQYDTQQGAFFGPLPTYPAYLRTFGVHIGFIVVQQGDINLTGKIYDIRPLAYYLQAEQGTGSEFELVANKGISGGYAPLDGSAKVPDSNSQVPTTHIPETTDQHPRLSNVLATGLLYGGKITPNGGDLATFDLSAGFAVVVDNYTNATNPTRTHVSWGDRYGLPVPTLATPGVNETYIGMDSTGTIVYSTDPFTDEQRRDIIILGFVGHPGHIQIEYTLTEPEYAADLRVQFGDFIENFGPFNIDGNEYYASGANLKVSKNYGKTYDSGANYAVSSKSPNIVTEDPEADIDLYYYRTDGSGDWLDTPSAVKVIDTAQYDTGTGLAPVTPGLWTIQTIFHYAPQGSHDLQYGQVVYATKEDARSALTAAIDIDPYLAYDTFRSWLIVQSGCIHLNDLATAEFVSAGKLGLISIASGGGAGGEINTASNIGTAGVGVYAQKAGVDLQFKNIAPGSGMISVSNDSAGHNIIIDANVVGSLNGSTGALSVNAAQNLTVSNTANTVSLFGPANLLFGMTLGGNSGTTGSSQIANSGILLAGGSNVTLSQSNNSISIHAQVQSHQPVVDSLNASTGAMSVSASQNLSASNTASTVILYGPANLLYGVTVGGNTGTTGSSEVANSGLILAGGSNITLSQSNNIISIHAAAGAQSTQPAVGSLNGSSGTMSISGASNITASNNNSTIIVYGPANLFFGVSVGGNTGTTGSSNVSNSGFVIAGGSNVTLSQSNNSISIHATYVAQTVQPAIGSLNGSSGTMSVSGASNITASNNNSTITIYGPASLLYGVSVGGNTGTTGSSNILNTGFVLAGGSNVTLSQSNATISIHAQSQSAQPAIGSLNGSSGTMSISGASNITASNNASTITIYGPASLLYGVSVGGNTGTTGSSNISNSGFIIAGGSNVTLSQSNNSISIHAANQTVQPAIGTLNGSSGTMSISASQNATASNNNSTIIINGPASVLYAVSVGGNTGTTGSSNISNSGFVLAGGSKITLSQSNNSISIHGAVQVASLNGSSGTMSVSASANATAVNNNSTIVINGPASVLFAMSVGGNTGTTGSSNVSNSGFVLAGGSNVTLSQSNNSISIHATYVAQTTQPAVGSLNGSSGTMSISGASNITASNNASTITIYGPASVLYAMSVGGNTGTTGSSNVSNSGFVLAGGSNVTLSQSNNSISIHVPAQSVQPAVGSLNGSSGTMSISGASNITASNNASTITIYGPASLLYALSVGGNTGTTGSSNVSNSGFVLAGGSNVTLSQSNNSISIHVLAQSTQPAVGSLNGSSGTMSISGASNITASNNASTITIYGPASVLYGISVGGNTGTTGSSNVANSGFILAGGSNITLSQSNNIISIHGPTVGGAQTGISGIIASDATYTSGSVYFSNQGNVTIGKSVDGASQYVRLSVAAQSAQPAIGSLNGSSGTMSISGASNITASNNASTITIYGPASVLFGMSVGGNTGTTGSSNVYNTGFILAGGANITISQSNNSISIVGGAAAAGVGSLNGSSGTMSISGASNITASNNNSTITIYGPSSLLYALSVGGNTGTTGSSNISNSGFILAGGSNVTLSQSNNSISVHAQSQSAQPAVGSLNGSSGTMSISGASNITASNNASTITIYGPASLLFAMSVGGNTGTTGSSNISNSGFVLAGGSNVTLSQSNNSISIHVPAQSTQPAVGSLNGSSGTLTIVAGNNISVSNTANTISIINLLTSASAVADVGPVTSAGTMSSSYALADHVHRGVQQFKISGNTSGSDSAVYNTIALSGNNNITVSMITAASAGTIGISGPNALFGLTVGGNSGTTGSSQIVNSGFILAGGNNVTVNISNNTISISGAATHAQQTGISAVVVSDATYTTGTVYFSNQGNITIGSSLNGGSQYIRLSVAAQTAENDLKQLNGSSGTMSISGASNITASNNASTITIYGPASIIYALSVGGNTGTTGSSNISNSGFILAGGSNITLSQSNNSISIHGGGGGVGSLNGSTGTMSISGASNITASNNASTITIYGPASLLYALSVGGNTGTTGSSNISNSGFVIAGGSNVTLSQSNNSISIHVSPSTNSTFAGGVSSDGNTAGQTGLVSQRLVLVGSNNISLNQATNAQSATITISGPASVLFAISVGGNTGTTGSSQIGNSGFVLAGGSNVTLSQSNNSISIHCPGGMSAGVSTGGNTEGLTGVVASQIAFVGLSGINLSQSSNGQSATVTIYVDQLSSWEVAPMHGTGTSSVGLATNTSAEMSLFGFELPRNVLAEYMGMMVTMSFITGGTSSFRQSGTWWWGLYSRLTGANSTRMSVVGSSSLTYGVTYNNSAISISFPNVTNAGAADYGYVQTNSAGLNVSSDFTGNRLMMLKLHSTLTCGHWWLGIHHRMSSTSFNSGIRMSILGMNMASQTGLAPWGAASTLYTTGTKLPLIEGGQWNPMGAASYSVAGLTSLTNDVTISQMTANINCRPYIRFGTRI